MRNPILVFILCTAACRAQRPEDAVVSVYRQMEKAEQTGNGSAWIDLWSPKSKMAANADQMKNMIRPLPANRYGVTNVVVDGDRAALAGTFRDQYLCMRFVRENGVWKILDQTSSNVPIDRAALYALVPPVDGAFGRAGSPWESVPRAAMNTGYFKPEELTWKLQAIHDESYLYVRIEAAKPFPAPNTEVAGTFPNLHSGVSRDWPVMKIRIAEKIPRELTFNASDVVGDYATFDENGKANHHRHFVAYSLEVSNKDHILFTAGTEEPLIAVKDRMIDLKLPLKALGIDALASPKIEICDANQPASKFLAYAVTRFAR